MKTFAILITMLFLFSAQVQAQPVAADDGVGTDIDAQAQVEHALGLPVQVPVVYGVGVEITEQGASILVAKVLNGSPAEHAGIQVGDQIVAIDGEQTSAMKLSEAAQRTRGLAHSKIELTIVRLGTVAFTVSLARDFGIPPEWLKAEQNQN